MRAAMADLASMTFSNIIRRAALACAAIISAPLCAQYSAGQTPDAVVASAAPGEWITIPPEDLLVMTLAPDAQGQQREVVIQLLPPPYSQGWVANVRTLARANWWDGLDVYRVVDNFVAQWGDGEDERPDPKPLPPGIAAVPETQYTVPVPPGDLLAGSAADILARAGLAGSVALSRDPYAPITAFANGWPVGLTFDSQWPVHCYGTVGVARDLSPDTGTGAELYAIIGHAPRHLDRNLAVVGRVIEGMEHLARLPRGTADLGVYATDEEHTQIETVRLVSDLAPAEQPAFQYLDTGSATFARYVAVREARADEFYRVPAGGVDVCAVQVPVRRAANASTPAPAE